MLITMKSLTREFDLHPRGVVHVGAHLAEERAAYEAAGVERVVWIEANPALIPALTERAKGKLETRVVNAVLGDRDGKKVTFHLADNGQSSSILEPWLHREHHPKIKFTGSIELTTTTFRTLMASQGIELAGYDFLNLDIQGAELHALEGMGDLVLGFTAVYTEVNTIEVYKGCARLEQLDTWLLSRGFKRVKTAMTKHGWGDALYLNQGR